MLNISYFLSFFFSVISSILLVLCFCGTVTEYLLDFRVDVPYTQHVEDDNNDAKIQSTGHKHENNGMVFSIPSFFVLFFYKWIIFLTFLCLRANTRSYIMICIQLNEKRIILTFTTLTFLALFSTLLQLCRNTNFDLPSIIWGLSLVVCQTEIKM